MTVRTLVVFLVAALLAGCSGIQPLGTLGPKELPVYLVKHNDFLTANRMIVVLGSNGEVAAAVGGTAAGWGPSAMSLASGIAMGAGIAYAGNSLSDALRSIDVKAGGSIDLQASQGVIGGFPR